MAELRAFSYVCLSLKLGFVLPGTPTVIEMIMEQQGECFEALRVANAAYAATGEPDLDPMVKFFDRLLARQFASVV